MGYPRPCPVVPSLFTLRSLFAWFSLPCFRVKGSKEKECCRSYESMSPVAECLSTCFITCPCRSMPSVPSLTTLGKTRQCRAHCSPLLLRGHRKEGRKRDERGQPRSKGCFSGSTRAFGIQPKGGGSFRLGRGHSPGGGVCRDAASAGGRAASHGRRRATARVEETAGAALAPSQQPQSFRLAKDQ